MTEEPSRQPSDTDASDASDASDAADADYGDDDYGDDEIPEPTAEQAEARRQRANRATRGALAAVLCLEAFVVLLIPRTIAQTSEGLDGVKTTMLVVFAVVLVITGFLLRRRWGIALGSVLQVGLAATVVLVPLLAVVVVMFLALWLYLLRTRHQLLGTPSGWRMLVS